jgi:hypothetical protein
VPLRRLRRLALRDMPTLRRRIASLTGFLAPARRHSYLVIRKYSLSWSHMLFRINTVEKQAEVVPVATLSSLGLKERYDLQEWVIHNPQLLGEDLFVVIDEFSGFDTVETYGSGGPG